MNVWEYTDGTLKCIHSINQKKKKSSHFIWALFKNQSLRMLWETGMDTSENVLGILI